MRRAIRRFLLFPLLAIGLGAAAQRSDDTHAKTDTTVADTVVVGADGPSAPSGQQSSGIDTTSVADTAQTTVDSLYLRSVPDTVVGGWRKSPRFAYANDPDYWRRRPKPSNGFADWLLHLLMSKGFWYFIYIIVGAVLVYVIVRIMTDNNLGIFNRKKAARQASAGLGEEEKIEEEDLDAGLQRALENRDWRRAVRYLYLRTLRGLGEQQLIRLTAQSTNHEYLRQLAGTSREASFRFLTLAYEKVWYGEFTLSEVQFRRLDSLFMDFDKTVRS